MIKELELQASPDHMSVAGKEENHDGDWKGSICIFVDDAEHGCPQGPSFAGTVAPPSLSGKLVLPHLETCKGEAASPSWLTGHFLSLAFPNLQLGPSTP